MRLDDLKNVVEHRLRVRERVLLRDVQEHRVAADAACVEGAGTGVGDAGDEAVASVTDELRALETERDVVELRDIVAALRRLAEGSYGICDDCGEEIAYERLDAHPAASRCMSMSGAARTSVLEGARGIALSDTSAAWQVIARFNTEARTLRWPT
jgi:DnaK suppressor protein